MEKTWEQILEERFQKARQADADRAERFAAQRAAAEAKAAKGRAHIKGASYFRRDGRFVLGNND